MAAVVGSALPARGGTPLGELLQESGVCGADRGGRAPLLDPASSGGTHCGTEFRVVGEALNGGHEGIQVIRGYGQEIGRAHV